jgi:N-dimethylarginine dimethylaminohydrolase
MCEPKYYGIHYEINPWMNVGNAPDTVVAQKQWETLRDKLLSLGVTIEYVDPTANQPDMVFTANAGLVKGQKCVASKFRFPERQGEEKGYFEWFNKNNFQTVFPTTGDFEGEGDALFIGETLICGYGLRSDPKTHLEVCKILFVQDSIILQLVDPRFYHVDTCIAPLTIDTVMAYPPAFSAETFKKITDRFKVLVVEETEALKFACNAIVLGKDIVLPAGCPNIMRELEKENFVCHPVQLDQFIKAGGAAKCMVLKLEQ